MISLVDLWLPILLSAAFASSPQRGDSEHAWPYGLTDASDPRSQLARQDLFNLGIIGAKAWDADRPDPAPRQGGRRRITGGARPERDEGPSRLVLRAIYPRGPADRAGLRRGDILVGAGGKSFKKGCFAPLARALLRAESTKGDLRLAVERAGKKIEVTVKIAKGGKESAKPTAGKAGVRALARALDWLAERQLSTGGFAPSLGGRNGAVVMTSLAGLAWMTAGSSGKRGKYRKNVESAYDFVTRSLGAKDPLTGRLPQGSNWDQTTWAYAHAGIFLGELFVADRSKKVKAELGRVAETLARRQEATGGYAHGPGGKNALGYLELNIMAGFVLTTLGFAEQAGCEIDGAVHERLLAYVEASSSGGGVGYSTADGQRGQGNIGRTAGAWLGAVACGLRKKKFVKRMESWTQSHVDDVLGGHATLMQHILLAVVAADALGSKATAKFWKALERDFVLARAPDGSFQARPWHESLRIGNNTDVSMGEAWTTASWAIALGLRVHSGGKGGKRGLPGWTGRSR